MLLQCNVFADSIASRMCWIWRLSCLCCASHLAFKEQTFMMYSIDDVNNRVSLSILALYWFVSYECAGSSGVFVFSFQHFYLHFRSKCEFILSKHSIFCSLAIRHRHCNLKSNVVPHMLNMFAFAIEEFDVYLYISYLKYTVYVKVIDSQ